jgi:phosphoribosylformylglycinamidine synthase
VETTRSPFLAGLGTGQVLRMPIAHGEGNYYASPDLLAELEANQQLALRYCDERGEVLAEANPNGSTDNVAGVLNHAGNVFGLMPHPERASEALLGGEDGRLLLASVLLIGANVLVR